MHFLQFRDTLHPPFGYSWKSFGGRRTIDPGAKHGVDASPVDQVATSVSGRASHQATSMTSKFGNLRVLVVEDDPLVLREIGSAVARSTTMAVVGEAFTGAEGVARFEALQPDVVLVDIHVPRAGGLDVIERIRARSATAIVLGFGTHHVDAMAKRVLAAGAQAFLTTGSIQGELAATVDRVVGRPGRSQGRSPRASAGTGAAILTEREVEVLRSVAAGHTNRQIAALMAISDETVKGHMKNISAKLGARHRAEAVALAYRRGVIGL